MNGSLSVSNKYVKAKTKSYNNKIKANFHGSKVPKEGSPCSNLPIIVIDSVFKLGKKLLPTAISSRMQVQHKRKR